MRRNVIHLLLGLFFLAGLTACGEGEAPGNGGVNSISGRITLATTGAGVFQVELTLFGSGSGNTFTDSNGFYSFPNLQDGTYNIVLSKPGYTFIPPTFVITINGASVTDQNSLAYTINGGVNSISGRITLATTGAGVPQVELTLFGSGSGNTFTDASGFYSFPNLQDGTYNIVLSKTGYTFSPGTFVVTMKGTSVTNQNSVAYALEPQTVADLNSVGFAQ